jgi:hypothetical protein
MLWMLEEQNAIADAACCFPPTCPKAEILYVVVINLALGCVQLQASRRRRKHRVVCMRSYPASRLDLIISSHDSNSCHAASVRYVLSS